MTYVTTKTRDITSTIRDVTTVTARLLTSFYDGVGICKVAVVNANLQHMKATVV